MHIDPADGWDGLKCALEAARPGHILTLAAGRYSGATMLNLQEGVSLIAKEGAELVFHGRGTALRAVGAPDILIQNLHLSSSFVPADIVTAGDQEPPLVEIDQCDRAIIVDCAFERRRKAGSILVVSGSRGTLIRSNLFDGATRGLCFLGTTGTIERNEVRASSFGIFVTSESDERPPSSATIIGNKCHGNEHGICLVRTKGCRIEHNVCWGNRLSGILVQGATDHRTPSDTVILGNRCSDNLENGITLHYAESTLIKHNICSGNQLSGILLLSTKCDLVTHNECQNNALSGILLMSDASEPRRCSEATLRFNDCCGNGNHGIGLSDSGSAAIEENSCHDNKMSGILLRGDSNDPQVCFATAIRTNRCKGNGNAGISLVTASSELISGNICSANGLAGILLGIFTEQATLGSTVGTITDNQCNNNLNHGIALSSSRTKTIHSNECSGNGQAGIILTRSDEFGSCGSEAEIRSNRCHRNNTFGIDLRSSYSEGIIDNDACANERSGIWLQPMDEAGLTPSKAPILSNRCFQNGECGIAIMQSATSGVLNNDCWSNQRIGLLLEGTPEVRSPEEGMVRGNRCHDNGQQGILLIARRASAIENNCCWGNGGSGLSLQCEADNYSRRSDAIVRANKSYRNGKSGIVLVSSSSESVEQNECHDNGDQGILLQGWKENLDTASSAPLLANYCYNNKQTGIAFFHSTAQRIEGNYLFGNEFADEITVIAGPVGEVEQQTAINFYTPPPADRLDQIHAAATLLEHAECRLDPVLIIEFLAGGGCVGCFTRALAPLGAPQRSGAETVPPATAHTSTRRHYLVEGHGDDAQFRSLSWHEAGSIGVLGASYKALTRRTTADAAASTNWTAIVTPDDDEIDRIIQLLRTPSTASLERNASKIHDPIIIDYDPRNYLGGTPPWGLMEAELAADRLWAARLSIMLRWLCNWPSASVVLIVGAIAFLRPDWIVGVRDVATLLLGMSWNATFKWIVANPGTTIGGTVLTILGIPLIINFGLPPALRFGAQPARSGLGRKLLWSISLAKWGARQLSGVPGMDAAIIQPLQQLWRARIAIPVERRAWRKWVRRRTFGRGPGVHTILLTHVEKVGAEDLARLSMLAADCPNGASLSILMQMDGRVCVYPAMLAVGDEAPWSAGFTLLLCDDDDKVKLDVASAIASQHAELSLLGARSAEQQTDLTNLLVDQRWSLRDLLPTFSIASAPTGKFSVRKLKTTENRADFVQEMNDYAKYFVTGGAEAVWTTGDIAGLFDLADNALSIRIYDTMEGRQTFERLAGRVGKRNRVAAIIGALWQGGDGKDAREYLASTLSCGIRHSLGIINMALQGPGEPDPDARKIVVIERALEALIFLGRDLAEICAGGALLHGTVELRELWDSVGRLFDGFGSSPARTWMAELYIGFLSARTACGAADTAAELAIIAALSNTARTMEGNDQGLARAAAKWLLKDIQALQVHDIELANHCVEQLRRGKWRLLSPAIFGEAARLIKETEARGRGLPALVDQATDRNQLEQIIAIHAGWPLRIVHALALSASAHILRETSSGERSCRDDALAAIALGVERSIASALARFDVAVDEKALRTDRASFSEACVCDGSVAFSWLTDPCSNDRFAEILHKQSLATDSPPVDIPGVIHHELERILSLGETIVSRRSPIR